MPTSPSPRRGVKASRPASPPPLSPRSLWPRLLLIGVAAVVAVVVCVLPASLVTRLLPPAVRADDFSGSVWHGSAGRITALGRPAGAIEWNIHPLALLRRHLVVDLHWVKGGFVLDGSADLTRTHIGASKILGGGPLADLSDLGIGAGWRGTASVRVAELTADLSGARPALSSAIGDVAVADVSAAQIASGANLGGYDLNFNDPVSASGDDMSATLTDTGGPLQVNAVIHLSTKTGSAIFSGTVKERPDTPAELRRQLDDLAQLHARDAQGRLPVDLEFTF
ncbi:MAG TPA: type II secretion system protein N [Steroidobacteraceae bacterium]|nr:type II secretion system protein N [Steroidobacteraceae bacterium]